MGWFNAVVYFNQPNGASQAIHWSKSSFSMYILPLLLSKAPICWLLYATQCQSTENVLEAPKMVTWSRRRLKILSTNTILQCMFQELILLSNEATYYLFRAESRFNQLEVNKVLPSTKTKFLNFLIWLQWVYLFTIVLILLAE